MRAARRCPDHIAQAHDCERANIVPFTFLLFESVLGLGTPTRCPKLPHGNAGELAFWAPRCRSDSQIGDPFRTEKSLRLGPSADGAIPPVAAAANEGNVAPDKDFLSSLAPRDRRLLLRNATQEVCPELQYS